MYEIWQQLVTTVAMHYYVNINYCTYVIQCTRDVYINQYIAIISKTTEQYSTALDSYCYMSKLNTWIKFFIGQTLTVIVVYNSYFYCSSGIIKIDDVRIQHVFINTNNKNLSLFKSICIIINLNFQCRIGVSFMYYYLKIIIIVCTLCKII